MTDASVGVRQVLLASAYEASQPLLKEGSFEANDRVSWRSHGELMVAA